MLQQDSSMKMLLQAVVEVERWCLNHNIPNDHGTNHAINVLSHAMRVCDRIPYKYIGMCIYVLLVCGILFPIDLVMSICLTCILGIAFLPKDISCYTYKHMCIFLAAFLHDLDDRKYVKNEDGSYMGVRTVLRNIGFTSKFGDKGVQDVINMVKIVSCSSNGNIVDPNIDPMSYIPRDCDRLESLGYIGIIRCYETTVERSKRKGIAPVFFTPSTPRCTTLIEIEKVATSERFEAYQRTGESESLIDHIFDKILHIHKLSSNNYELQEIANKRRDIILEFLIEFGKTGDIVWSNWLQKIDD